MTTTNTTGAAGRIAKGTIRSAAAMAPGVAAGLAAGLLAGAIPALAVAGALPPRNQTDDAWRFTLAGYSFLPATTSGTSTLSGAQADVDLDMRDVLEALNFAASMRGEAWKGDFGIILDLNYLNLSGGADTTTPGGDFVRADFKMKQGWVGLFGAYRAAYGVYGDAGRRYSVDLQAGLRYNALRQTLRASVDIGGAPGGQRSLGGAESWWEPVVGARGAIELNDRWSATLAGDIAAMDDDLQWRLRFGATYQAAETTALHFGWQVYGIDFATNRADGKFAYDVIQSGPYMALSYQFQ